MADFPTLKMRRQAGFTLIELMFAIAVAGVLLMMAVPSFQDTIASNALRSTTSDLVTALNTARAQAVNTRRDVTLTSDGDWSVGWFVEYEAGATEEDESFMTRQGVEVSEANGRDEFVFSPSGLVDNEASFDVCDDRTGEKGRRVSMTRFGAVNNEQIDCN